MKQFLRNTVLLFIIIAVIIASSVLYIGIKHGSGNRALLTMRSGLIKIRRGLYEFGWGLRDFAFKGVKKYQGQKDTYGLRELEILDYQEEQRTLEEKAALEELLATEKVRAAEKALEARPVEEPQEPVQNEEVGVEVGDVVLGEKGELS